MSSNFEIGFGTYGISDERIIYDAIDCGYRHFDSASHYYNEEMLGRVFQKSSCTRDTIRITTKLWYSDMGYKNALLAFEKSATALQTDYIDEYLIHWPAAADKYPDWEKTNIETWRALENLHSSGRVGKIGVCNFMLKHLFPLMEHAQIKPFVNQIESHPGFFHRDVITYCRSNNIAIEGWSPMGTGELLQNTTLSKIAAKYKKSVAQLCIRWNLQHGVLPLPKASSKDHMSANRNVNDFQITIEDMAAIDSMPFSGGEGAVVK